MSSKKYTNRLSLESSPYLQQHAHNPIDWYPWCDEALEKAKAENKLIIVSIGYAACHWCHVMEHESFEDEEVAEFMNENFVAIKVDREERPDIDQIYMSAVNLLTGSGGWPLNCITLPDGRPIWGGTYFPKAQWVNMLHKVLAFVKNSPDKAEEQARSVTEGVAQPEMHFQHSQTSDYSPELLHTLWKEWQHDIDFKEGGTKGAPKFPLPVGYNYLLAYNYHYADSKLTEALTTTLDKMALGGIYDQLGGGFARYSTDEYWIAPHFEKMLYDNGQLVSLYSRAYQALGNKLYAHTVHQTLEFVERELSSPDGGFYSSLDADSEGVEGKFYVWDYSELSKILEDKLPLFADYYSVTKIPNWEEGNILFRRESLEKLSVKHAMPQDEIEKQIKECEKILMKVRDSRIRPGLDDKILTSWNALMLQGFVDAYAVFQREEYLDRALKGAHFVRECLTKENGSLYRNYKDGKATINAFIDDYAFTIQFYLSLYQVTFDELWLRESQRLLQHIDEHFLEKNSQHYYFTSDLDRALIARKIELTDNVIPAGNSQMCLNLYTLGKLTDNETLLKRSEAMLSPLMSRISRGRAYFSNWAKAAQLFITPSFTVSITGENAEEKRQRFEKEYLPHIFYNGGTKPSAEFLKEKDFEVDAMIYCCENGSCKAPTTDVAEALEIVKG